MIVTFLLNPGIANGGNEPDGCARNGERHVRIAWRLHDGLIRLAPLFYPTGSARNRPWWPSARGTGRRRRRRDSGECVGAVERDVHSGRGAEWMSGVDVVRAAFYGFECGERALWAIVRHHTVLLP